jgi:hypothetical protein
VYGAGACEGVRSLRQNRVSDWHFVRASLSMPACAAGVPVRTYCQQQSLRLNITGAAKQRVLSQIRMDSACVSVAVHIAAIVTDALANVEDDIIAGAIQNSKTGGKLIAESALHAVTGALNLRKLARDNKHELDTALRAPGLQTTVDEVSACTRCSRTHYNSVVCSGGTVFAQFGIEHRDGTHTHTRP